MEEEHKFYMIGIEPTLEESSFGVDLEFDNGWWRWWEPGRPHSIQGSEPEAHPDGWFKITRLDPGMPDVWFKDWGEWVWPYAPSVQGMTDEEAIAWAANFWEQELISGGG